MAPKKKTPKGKMTVSELVKATKSLVDELPKSKTKLKGKRKRVDRKPFMSPKSLELVLSDVQETRKENAKLTKQIHKLKQGEEKQNIKVESKGEDYASNKSDTVDREKTNPVIEDVDMDASNIPTSLVSFNKYEEEVGNCLILTWR